MEKIIAKDLKLNQLFRFRDETCLVKRCERISPETVIFSWEFGLGQMPTSREVYVFEDESDGRRCLSCRKSVKPGSEVKYIAKVPKRWLKGEQIAEEDLDYVCLDCWGRGFRGYPANDDGDGLILGK